MRFVIKLVLNGIFVVPLLMWFSRATFTQSACTAVILCVLAYFIGDQGILRISNNAVATVADVILSFMVLWLAAYLMNWDLSMTEMIIISLVVGVVEIFFHRYLRNTDGAART